MSGPSDKEMEAALNAGDVARVAEECERRLRTVAVGGSISFRCGPDRPIVWRMPAYKGARPYANWAATAAVALLADWRRS